MKYKLRGYIALTSVLVIAAVLVVIVVTVTLVSISEGQMSLAEFKKEEAVNTTEACVEEALYRLKRTKTIQTEFLLPETTCFVTIDSQVGDNWVFTVTTSASNYTKKFQIDATHGEEIIVNSWQEIE